MLDVRLRSPDWQEYVEKELEMFSENTVAFYESDAGAELEVVDDQIACTPSLSEMQGSYSFVRRFAFSSENNLFPYAVKL